MRRAGQRRGAHPDRAGPRISTCARPSMEMTPRVLRRRPRPAAGRDHEEARRVLARPRRHRAGGARRSPTTSARRRSRRGLDGRARVRLDADAPRARAVRTRRGRPALRAAGDPVQARGQHPRAAQPETCRRSRPTRTRTGRSRARRARSPRPRARPSRCAPPATTTACSARCCRWSADPRVLRRRDGQRRGRCRAPLNRLRLLAEVRALFVRGWDLSKVVVEG